MTIALEGTPVHANASSGTSIACPAFTTTQAAEIFIAITLNTKVVSSISGGGLTWAKRASADAGGPQPIELWAAQAGAALSGTVFTVNFSGAVTFVTVDVFAFSGQDTVTIWDGNAAIPATAVSRPVTYSTNNANDVIISCFRMTAVASPTAGTGFTKISGANFQLVQYKINSATETNATADTGSSAVSNGAIADALMQAATVPVAVVAATAPSGGIVDLGRHRRKKTKEELAAEREKFGIPDEARIAIEEAARRQALAQEQSAQDEQKNFEELSRELTLRGVEWDVRYLEAMNTLREKLIEQQREEMMKAKRDEEDVIYLLQVVAEVA